MARRTAATAPSSAPPPRLVQTDAAAVATGGSGRSSSPVPGPPIPPPRRSSSFGSSSNHRPLSPPTDPKLFHLVRKIASFDPTLSPSKNGAVVASTARGRSRSIFDALLADHREYRRKDPSTVLAAVEAALERLAAATAEASNRRGDGGSSGSSPPRQQQQPGRKRKTTPQSRGGGGGTTETDLDRPRKRRFDEEEEEESYEREVAAAERRAEEEAAAAGGGGFGGSMLNAGLRERYQAAQKKRDAAARAAAAEEQRRAREEEERRALHREEEIIVRASEGMSVGEEEEEGEDEAKGSVTPPPAIPEETEGSGGAFVGSRPATPTSPVPPLARRPSTGGGGSAGGSAPPPPPSGSTKKRKKKSRGGSAVARSDSGAFALGSDVAAGGDATAIPTPRPAERYSDLGGMDATLTQIREIVEYPLKHPEVFRHLGVDPPRGVLLRGPPGTGKTHLANAIAGQLNVPYFRVSAPEIVSGMSGESEGRIRGLFASAAASAPSIVFVDEIDAIAPKRDSGGGGGGGARGMEKRMVAQLLTCLDDLRPSRTNGNGTVMVLGATNRPDSLDPALRRAGRFDREISLGVPDEKAREGILRVATAGMRISGDFDYKVLARKTPGFVGADVRSLTKEAAVIAVNRIFGEVLGDGGAGGNPPLRATEDVPSTAPLTPEQLSPLRVAMSDFLAAVPNVQPSSKREGFATVPDVTWDDVGALQPVREELTLSVLEPIRHPEKFEALGLPLPAGVLLYGPPGCGKTLLAKAVANESGANFISVKGPELLDKYVGESERAVRVVFDRARSSSPCIVFFDELDSLCPRRGSDGGGGGGGVSERVVNQLLTEMDGLDSRRSVFVMAATNRPELIDPAMMRPGRLDKLLYVPLPSPSDRSSILRALSGKINLGPDVDLDAIARSNRADGYSGADCAALLREAGLAVLRDDASPSSSSSSSRAPSAGSLSSDPDGSAAEEEDGAAPNRPRTLRIAAEHFRYAFDHVMPSVSRKDQARYDRMRDRMARARSRGGGVEPPAAAEEKGVGTDDVAAAAGRSGAPADDDDAAEAGGTSLPAGPDAAAAAAEAPAPAGCGE